MSDRLSCAYWCAIRNLLNSGTAAVAPELVRCWLAAELAERPRPYLQPPASRGRLSAHAMRAVTRCKQNDSNVAVYFQRRHNAVRCMVPFRFFPTADLITMHPIQGTHIAVIFKLATQQLEALRVAPEIQKEYSEILVLREKIKLATELKKARRQPLLGAPRALEEGGRGSKDRTFLI
ncbi:hypothetical protein [Bradyrhizobium sp. 131]|uniref:hypothetical protein n=1 Tax=Bradyrhizobium sp. 131 TaxID=2782609 RepID=UPI001FFF0B2A|nr:hypothetical protein [Bradyrhizobium sp. 131]